ncbi:S-adenosyl-L-methionine-dependent methyltransferase [Thozetella sp. PMI_491]|nr:S-adenosyl-L-methionine-dependent methyltransferase [Thozetella sp. PMI_491]
MSRKKFRGGRGGRGGRGRGGGGGRGGRDDLGGRRPYQSYPEVPKENSKLQTYYDGLLQLPEEEKAEFWAALRRELPNSFRFCGHKGHALTVKGLLETRYIPEITKITSYDGLPVDPPKPVPWYPDSLAWWMTTPKNIVRRFPPFAAFQKFLVSETSVGNISRQEVVSMIPPLLMDLHPGMTVLDMCAAPGSKAAQLLEMIHRGEEDRIRKVIQGFTGGAEAAEDDESKLEADPGDDGRATGLLIANDSDYKRSHLLIHQLKRLSSPNMIVTNHDATMYPPLRLPSTDPKLNAYLKFDRILADVPCSGDGTLRKNVNIWKDWSPSNGLGLHLTQTRILVRALQMLKPDGRMVYSTCSMNPVENESVVAAAIERCGGADKIEIVDCSDQLTGLKRAPGLKKWQIMDKAARIWNNWEEVMEFTKTTEDGLVPGRLVESMFPPVEGTQGNDLPLERCMRVYGHMQDTGAFFITVLRKKADFKAKPEAASPNEAILRAQAVGSKRPRDEDGEEAEAKRQKVEAATNGNGTVDPAAGDADAAMPDASDTGPAPVAETEAPVVLTEEPVKAETTAEDGPTAEPAAEDPILRDGEATETPTPTTQTPGSGFTQQEKKKQDGPYEEPFKFLPPDHEVTKEIATFYGVSDRFPSDRYLVRNATGNPAKAIYYTSALVRDILVMNEGRGVKFIHGGVKMFVKQDAPSADVCRWRIQSEGMPILHGYVSADQVVTLHNKETLKRLLVEMFPMISDGGWENFNEIGEKVRDMRLGCSVLRVEPDGTDPDFTEHIALPLWKSFKSLNLMLPKDDRTAMLLRIYNDTTPLVNMGIAKRALDGTRLPEEPKVEEAATTDVIDLEDAPSDIGQVEGENGATESSDGAQPEAASEELQNGNAEEEARGEE